MVVGMLTRGGEYDSRYAYGGGAHEHLGELLPQLAAVRRGGAAHHTQLAQAPHPGTPLSPRTILNWHCPLAQSPPPNRALLYYPVVLKMCCHNVIVYTVSVPEFFYVSVGAQS